MTRWLGLLGISILLMASSSRALDGKRPAQLLQSRIDAAKVGDVVDIPPGMWVGHLRIRKRITLRGKGGILDGMGKGKVLVVDAPGVVLEHLRVQNSGYDLGGPDSCIYLTPASTGSILRHNRLRNCAFGIWTHEVKKVQILENDIVGRSEQIEPERGNGIHLFDSDQAIVRGNRVRGARDGIYVSAVEDSLFERNHLTHLRYGIHYMFSYRNTLRHNLSNHNLSGFALMESHHMIVADNQASHNQDHGILFRDAQYCKIERNRITHNGEGLFFFSSADNLIRDNLIKQNKVGARIWAGTLRNQVTRNAFIGNAQQIYYVSTRDQVWAEHKGEIGNYWSDYMGWDQDRDGIGDRPYRCDSFTANLLYRHPAAIYLLRSPTLELLTQLEHRLPVIRVPTIIDRRPLMQWRAPQ